MPTSKNPTRRGLIGAAGLAIPAAAFGSDGRARTDPVTNGGDGVGAFLQYGDHALVRDVRDKMRDIVSVKDFGAKGDGTTDDTSGIQAAIDVASSFGNTYISIYFPPGKYRITQTIKIHKNKTRLFGAGDKSCLYFDPASSDKVMLLVQSADPSQLINYIAIESFGMIANPALKSYKKTAIKLIDASLVTIRNINQLDYSWVSGGTSIGIHLCGRDTHTIDKCTFNTDRPIYGDKNPNSTKYQFDGHTFTSLWLYTIHPDNYAITFAPGVNPSNWSLTGNSNAYGGKGGIYLNNEGVKTETASMIKIDMFRCESGTGSGGSAGGYAVYMAFGVGNPACGNIEISNSSANDPTLNGYYLNRVSALVVRNVNAGFAPGNQAFILTNVGNATIVNLGIGHDAAVVRFNSMYAQRVVKLAGAYGNPVNASIALGIFTHYDVDEPNRNLAFTNGCRDWAMTKTGGNGTEIALPTLANAAGSMMVKVSCAAGAALYHVTYAGAAVVSGTAGMGVGGSGIISLTNLGSGVSKLVNISGGSQHIVVSSIGSG